MDDAMALTSELEQSKRTELESTQERQRMKAAAVAKHAELEEIVSNVYVYMCVYVPIYLYPPQISS